jgi:uncharacterized membrane protein YeaQ/YmgE (transglycosylase-associated protein family)
MPLVSWIVVGLVLGYLARFITRRRFGFIRTLIAGLIGGVVGGFIGWAVGFGGIFDNFNIWSFLISIGAAAVVLIVMGLMHPVRSK